MVQSGQIIFNSPPPPTLNRQEKKEKAVSEKEKEKVETLIQKAQRVLLEIHTLFPFDLFPDKLTIDENKVNVVTSEFFFSGRVHSVMIKDISDVLADAGLLFAKLQIIDKGYIENSIELRYLRREDALKARRIIQGLIMARDAGIDLTKLDDKDLLPTIEKMGSTQKPGL